MGTFCVYCLTSPSGKKYIGQTNDFARRMRDYKRKSAPGQPKLRNALLSYGFDAFTIDVLYDQLSIADANHFETRMIVEYDTMNPEFGYNCNLGGDNRTQSAETNQKRSMAMRGRVGRVPSEDVRRKISDALSGRPTYKRTDAHCKRARNARVVVPNSAFNAITNKEELVIPKQFTDSALRRKSPWHYYCTILQRRQHFDAKYNGTAVSRRISIPEVAMDAVRHVERVVEPKRCASASLKSKSPWHRFCDVLYKRQLRASRAVTESAMPTFADFISVD